MSEKRGGTSKAQYSKGLSYVAATPAFLRNFGKAPPSPPPAGREGREPLPERPNEGRWARKSDDGKGDGEEEEEEDEWEQRFGGGGDEGPQVVVLKEGRHLTEEEVKRERRKAAGKASQSPPPPTATTPNQTAPASETGPKSKSTLPKLVNFSAKRKLVGADAEKDNQDKDGEKDGVAGKQGKKKKKKAAKGLLSFNEDEGES